MKRVTVLGVTGSVGRRTLELVEHFPDEFRLEGMAARGSDPALVAELCARHRPRVLALTDPAAVDHVARAISAPSTGPSKRRTEPSLSVIATMARPNPFPFRRFWESRTLRGAARESRRASERAYAAAGPSA